MTVPVESLMAFVDGELSPEEAARIAAAVAADPALAETVAVLRAGAEAARLGFATVLQEPVPAWLLAAAQAEAAPAAPAPRPANDTLPLSHPGSRRHPAWRWPALTAASLLLGLVGGYAAGWQGGGAALGTLGPAVQAALEQQPSGPAGEVTLLASHRIEGGGICRSFEAPAPPGVLRVLACRGPDGGWGLRSAVAQRDPGGMVPAAGEDPLTAEILERLGAGPALDAAAERAAIASGWRPAR